MLKRNWIFADTETNNSDGSLCVHSFVVGESGEVFFNDDHAAVVKYCLNNKIDNWKIFYHNLSFDMAVFFWRLDELYSLRPQHETDYWRVKEELKLQGYKGNELEGEIHRQIGNYYKLITTKMGAVISLTLYIEGKTLQFVDTFRLFPAGLARLGDELACEHAKRVGQWDYAIDHDIRTLTSAEIDYIQQDVLLLREIVDKLYDGRSLTSSQMAYGAFIKMVGKEALCENYGDNEINALLRSAYVGGFVWVNPKFKNTIQPVYSYDVNSEYPYAMAEYKYPTGKTSMTRGKPPITAKLWIANVRFTHGGAKTWIPACRYPGKVNDWRTHGDFEGWISSVQLESVKKHCGISNLEFIESVYWTQTDYIFRDFIIEHYKAKTEAKIKKQPARAYLAKLTLNSIYGKFAMMIWDDDSYFKRDDKGVYRVRNNFLSKKCEMVKSLFIAYSIFIADYARAYLFDGIAKQGPDNFLYSDTDSMYLNAPAKGLKIDKLALGAWGQEYTDNEVFGKFLGCKCYMVQVDGKPKMTVAGYNGPGVKEFDEFFVGAHLPAKSAKITTAVGVRITAKDYIVRER